ncbi:MAG: TrmH family RNA methyltransferase [Saprospiraceae bacterium]
MNDRRLAKIREVARTRQNSLGVILENVHDLHNLGAVMRTADSVGVREIYVVYSDPNITPKKVKLGKRTSAGTRRWLDVFFYDNLDKCMEDVRKKYNKIYATHLEKNASSVYTLNLTEKVALLFGNEKDGVSEAALKQCDGNFIIPQIGMAQSLNISVAAAITLYEAYRQRKAIGMYDENVPQTAEEQEALYQIYLERCKIKDDRLAVKIDTE